MLLAYDKFFHSRRLSTKHDTFENVFVDMLNYIKNKVIKEIIVEQNIQKQEIETSSTIKTEVNERSLSGYTPINLFHKICKTSYNINDVFSCFFRR